MPTRLLAPLFIVLAALPARAQLAPPLQVGRPVCRTDVAGTLERLRRAPPLPAPATLHAPKAPARASAVAAIELIDGSCGGGRCPAAACPDRPEDTSDPTLQRECWLRYELASRGRREQVYWVDPDAATSRFFQKHADTATAGWDEVVYFTTFFTTSTGGAYYAPVSNDVAGISRTYLGGRSVDEVYDTNAMRRTGSRGYLKGEVLMSDWHTCKSARLIGFACSRDDLSQGGVLGVLGQEVGHRWGSFMFFRDGSRASDELLGRDTSHWSYYVGSDGSPMEGNRWVDAPGGGWKLSPVAGLQFSPLDLYAMGALPPEEVPPTLLVRKPSPAPCAGDPHAMPDWNDRCTNASTAPASGVTQVTGTARMVSVDEIVAVEGARRPAFPAATRRVHLAFAILELPGALASAEEQRSLDDLRRQFTRAFYDGTNRRMRAITTLSRADDLGLFDFTLDDEGWTPGAGVAVADGRVALPLSGPATLTHASLELDAAREKVLQLRVSATRMSDVTLRLKWSDAATGDWSVAEVAAPATGATTTVQLPLDGLPGWAGTIRRMELETVPVNAPPAGEVSIDRVETFASAPEPDADGDLVPDAEDNCPARPNGNQHDSDANGVGDECEAGGGGDAPSGCGCSAGALPVPFLGLAALVRRRRR